MVISLSFLLRMRNVSDENCRENQKAHCVFSKFFFLENNAVFQKVWKSIVERSRPQTTIWRMRIVFLIPTATLTHTHFI